MARGMLQEPVLYHGVFMSFNAFQFQKSINTSLTKLGYTQPTPIQQQAIPHILEGGDLLGLAQTGTGKTAAFSLPILERLGREKRPNNKKRVIRALIISPTRELAEQTEQYLRKFTASLNLRSGIAYGGVSRQAQIKSLNAGTDILVACPGRLLDLANARAIFLNQVETLVLDEADQMFDQGFLPDIRKIIGKLPKNRQNLVFSATMAKEVRKLVDDILVSPKRVEIEHKTAVKNITHTFFQVEQNHKTALLKSLLQDGKSASALIFTRTKIKAQKLAAQLDKSGFTATSIQGNLSQQKRQKALDGFKQGRFKFLVATDIASRGIDVANLPLVINFDMPDTTEAYTHRTGRTGRAGAKGAAYSFTTRKELRLMRTLQNQIGDTGYKKTDPAALSTLLKEEAGTRQGRRPVAPQKSKRTHQAPKTKKGKTSAATLTTQKQVPSAPKQKQFGKRSSKQNQQEMIYFQPRSA